MTTEFIAQRWLPTTTTEVLVRQYDDVTSGAGRMATPAAQRRRAHIIASLLRDRAAAGDSVAAERLAA